MLSLKYLHTFVITFICMLYVISCWDECDGDGGRKICKHLGVEEFVCDWKQVPVGGVLQFHIPNTEVVKNFTLFLHNLYRNWTASGTLTDSTGALYVPAKRMRELIWDAELEYLAYVHAAHCIMCHSKCQATRLFPYAGQNLAASQGEGYMEQLPFYNRSITDWFKEHTKLNGPTAYHKITGASGHFTAMVNDQASRVGCYATVCFDNPSPVGYYLTCNYDMTNMINQPLYYPGKPASDCEHWGTKPSKEFSCLCQNSGKNFPMDGKQIPPYTGPTD